MSTSSQIKDNLVTLSRMAGYLKKAVRNFLIITVAIIAAIVILANSERARNLVTPPGYDIPAVKPGNATQRGK